MSMPPHLQLAALHNELLHVLSEAAGVHLTGLQQGARLLRARLSTAQARRIRYADIAYNVTRHITEAYSTVFCSEVRAALAEESQDFTPPPTPPSKRQECQKVRICFSGVRRFFTGLPLRTATRSSHAPAPEAPR